MTKNKKKTVPDRLKCEVAAELGLLNKALTQGWSSLTARESGRIGGIMRSKKQKQQRIENSSEVI
jgi:small acid-soluble spore protein F (minor alpha/beta-type SASP)